MEIGGKIIY